MPVADGAVDIVIHVEGVGRGKRRHNHRRFSVGTVRLRRVVKEDRSMDTRGRGAPARDRVREPRIRRGVVGEELPGIRPVRVEERGEGGRRIGAAPEKDLVVGAERRAASARRGGRLEPPIAGRRRIDGVPHGRVLHAPEEIGGSALEDEVVVAVRSVEHEPSIRVPEAIGPRTAPGDLGARGGVGRPIGVLRTRPPGIVRERTRRRGAGEQLQESEDRLGTGCRSRDRGTIAVSEAVRHRVLILRLNGRGCEDVFIALAPGDTKDSVDGCVARAHGELRAQFVDLRRRRRRNSGRLRRRRCRSYTDGRIGRGVAQIVERRHARESARRDASHGLHREHGRPSRHDIQRGIELDPRHEHEDAIGRHNAAQRDRDGCPRPLSLLDAVDDESHDQSSNRVTARSPSDQAPRFRTQYPSWPGDRSRTRRWHRPRSESYCPLRAESRS